MNTFIDKLLADIEDQREVEYSMWQRYWADLYDFDAYLADERFCPNFHKYYDKFERYMKGRRKQTELLFATPTTKPSFTER